MSNTAVWSHPAHTTPSTDTNLRWFVVGAFALWFALAFSLGAGGVFANPPGTPPFLLLAAVLLPIGLFLLAYLASRTFHDFVLAADLQLLTATQSWRFAGFGFLALNKFGLLPPYFAWPAAIGDMIIGITAPWIVLALARQPGFAASKRFVAWNIFGIFDFAVLAVGTGAVAPLIFPSLLQMLTPQMAAAAPMQHLPFSIIPTFFVPMFTIFHLVALFQARHLDSNQT